jgi:meso-butanediol dehydrogenase/(S,S)-butanediol dehydrogenase/diacetyl reductase
MEDALSDPTRFVDRAAVVTGAARGIGAATARRLAAEGARVLLVDREPSVTETASGIAGSVALGIDMLSDRAGERVVEAVLDAFGRFDILVNNAGIGGSKSLANTDDALLDRLIDTNLKAVLKMTRAALPHLSRPGWIVNVSSNFGLVGYPGTTAYAVAKAGVAQFTRQLAAEMAPEGIMVNGVAPGVIETNMTEAHLQNPYYLQMMVDPIPLRRIGRPEDIAAVIAFLASDDAAYVSGEVIVADGGWMTGRNPPNRAN